MKPRHRVSRAAIELITRFEGYRRNAAQLPDGRWMIGYGHTLTAREGAEVSEDDAEALLLYDLIGVSHAVNEWVFAPLTQNQFDAICSFAFNVGLEDFRRSGVLRRINEGALIQAACAMELWRKAEFAGERIVIDALVRRRAAEKALFLTPESGWPVAPSPLLKPLLDADILGLVPREPPTPVSISQKGASLRMEREPPPPRPTQPEEDEQASPVLAAAEAVASRLQTIFAEPAEAAEPEPDAALQAAELEPEAMPAGEDSDTVAPEPPPLVPDEAAAEELVVEEPETPPAMDAPSARALVSDDLVEPAPAPAPTAANDVAAEPERRNDDLPRILIDDTAPYEFVPPVVQPLPTRTPGGPLSLVGLAVIGLAFFGGGVFWALNARGAGTGGVIGPLTVGWLAGLAGVGLFSVAVFLILRRLGGDH